MKRILEFFKIFPNVWALTFFVWSGDIEITSYEAGDGRVVENQNVEKKIRLFTCKENMQKLR